MKKLLLLCFMFFQVILGALAYEPSGRGYDPDAPDIGLPSGNEVGIGVLIAFIAIPIGYAILNIGKGENSGDDSPFGCLGLIFIGGGIVCLLPLFAWLCTIGSILMVIGIAIMVIIGIIALIFGSNKK